MASRGGGCQHTQNLGAEEHEARADEVESRVPSPVQVRSGQEKAPKISLLETKPDPCG